MRMRTHLRNKRKNLEQLFCLSLETRHESCLHHAHRFVYEACTCKSIISENVGCLLLVIAWHRVWTRNMFLYLYLLVKLYWRKYWWPRCENKLSMRKNNSMFNCCIDDHCCNFVRERVSRVLLLYHIYIYYLTQFKFTFWELKENVEKREKI